MLIDAQKLGKEIQLSPLKVRSLAAKGIIPFFNLSTKDNPVYRFELKDVLESLKNRKCASMESFLEVEEDEEISFEISEAIKQGEM